MILLYKGTSELSMAIRRFTGSDYSHAAWQDPVTGEVIEAWTGGVQVSPGPGTLHTPGTLVYQFDIPGGWQAVTSFMRAQFGKHYDYAAIAGDVFHSDMACKDGSRWTCGALVFAAGFLANLGILTAFAGEQDVIIMDKLCHASLVDGARLSKAELRVFPHKNYEKCEELLRQYPGQRKLLVTESVFSMDGDLADLKKLIRPLFDADPDVSVNAVAKQLNRSRDRVRPLLEQVRDEARREAHVIPMERRA